MIKVTVPASTSNLGPGFDTLSLALELFNEFTFKTKDSGVTIHQNAARVLPEDSTNLVYRAFCEPFKKLKQTPPGIEITIDSKIPMAAGLGSSATAIVGGLLAANHLLNNKFSKEKIMSMATKLEGHPDNVASALYGGLTISYSKDEEVLVHTFPWPPELIVIVITPNFDLPTKIARELLPVKVPYGDATFNISCTAYLLASLLHKDWKGLKLGFQDRIHQPYRKGLVPGMDTVLAEALKLDACGATLSGAGPTLIAFVHNEKKVHDIAIAMQNKWNESNIESSFQILKVTSTGAKIEHLVVN